MEVKCQPVLRGAREMDQMFDGGSRDEYEKSKQAILNSNVECQKSRAIRPFHPPVAQPPEVDLWGHMASRPPKKIKFNLPS